jgi:hypothetical protein
MTYEELFDAYRQVVSQRDQLANAGDLLWGELARLGAARMGDEVVVAVRSRWEALRGIGNEPPLEDWSECQ